MIPQALILALILVESGGNNKAVGDNGKAYGCLQIWEAYVIDANQQAGTNYIHEDAFDRTQAIEITNAYMQRYATERRLGRQPTAQDIARIHNGGPNGWKKKATVGYWKKVQKALFAMGEYELAYGKSL
jgi:soluble lytic murein transglycosylase-like protein